MRKALLMAGAACLFATSVSALEFNPYVAAKAKYAFARNEVKVTGTFIDKKDFNDEVFGVSLAFCMKNMNMNLMHMKFCLV